MSEQPSESGSSKPRADAELWSAVQDFLDRRDAGEAIDLDEFCEGQPSALREAIREQCAAYLRATLAIDRDRGRRPVPDGIRDLGDFRLVRVLGSGGMGVVYLAWQHSLEREVALKLLSPQRELDPRAVDRFWREARAAARLQHDGIVRVLGCGEVDGSAYIAMDCIDGHSLAAEIDAQRAARQPTGDGAASPLLPPITRPAFATRAAELIQAVALALHHAHENAVVHRDVKPQNILVRRDGRPCVVDFGLAKDQHVQSMSRSGDFAGTPAFMSPEQALAKRVPIDRRTDVFSLGATMYALLALEHPFQGTTPQVLYAISFLDPQPLRKRNHRIHRDLETICLKAMEKRPERRFLTCAAMAEQLGRFLTHEPLTIRPPPPIVILVRRAARSRAVSTLAAVICVALLLLPLAIQWTLAGQHDRELSSMEQVVAAGLPDANAGDLRSILTRAQQLLADGLTTSQQARAGNVVDRIHAEGERRKQLGRNARAEGLVAAERTPFVSEAPLDRSLELFRQAAMLLPDDRELPALADYRSTLPSVTITGVRDGLPVFVRAIDPVTGAVAEPEPIGVTPVSRHALSRGLYRIVVVDPEVGFCEMTRLLDGRSQEHRLQAWLRPTKAVIADMAPVSAGTFAHFTTLRNETRAVEHEGFHVDTTEVTVGEYRRFLLDTRTPPPTRWQEDTTYGNLLTSAASDEMLREFSGRPMACLTLDEAVAYAEWAGKRLPTQIEWQRAARGEQAWPLPWSEKWCWPGPPPANADEASAGRNSGAPAESGAERSSPALSYLPQYLRGTCDVSAHPPDRHGLRGTFCSLQEWTHTPATTRAGAGDPTAVLGLYIVCGMGWNVPEQLIQQQKATLTANESREATAANHGVGFRCVKGVWPSAPRQDRGK